MTMLKIKVFALNSCKYIHKSVMVGEGPSGFAGVEVVTSPCKKQKPQVICSVPAPKKFQKSAIKSIREFLNSSNTQFFCDVCIKDILWNEEETTHYSIAHAAREAVKSALRYSELGVYGDNVIEARTIIDGLLSYVSLRDSPEGDLCYKHLGLRNKGIIDEDLTYDKQAYAEYIDQRYQESAYFESSKIEDKRENTREENELTPNEVEQKWQKSSPLSPKQHMDSGKDFFEVLLVLIVIIIAFTIAGKLMTLIFG